LNTYGLRRTALNEKIVLDAGEAIIEPNKPVMVHAGDDKNDPKAALDEILKEFNERWFHGWQATPDDQKTKLVSIARAVKNNEQYREFVVGNPDPQTSSDKMNEILDSVVRQQRKSDNSLYKSYLQDESFRADFRNLIIRMLDNLDYLQ
jgi:type I restriction enzyme R subunit